MTGQAICVFATFHPIEGQEARVRSVLETVAAGTRSEPGNEIYDLYRSDSDGRIAFHLFERYVDETALQAHRDSEHYKQYRAEILDLLSQPISVVLLNDVAVEVR